VKPLYHNLTQQQIALFKNEVAACDMELLGGIEYIQEREEIMTSRLKLMFDNFLLLHEQVMYT
jgi:hypothetical protein